MQNVQNRLANAIRNARMKQNLTQDQLAEILGLDKRTITSMENGHGNPKLESLSAVITYLKIPADAIFYPDTARQNLNLQRMLIELDACTEQEIDDLATSLIPIIQTLLALIRKQKKQ